MLLLNFISFLRRAVAVSLGCLLLQEFNYISSSIKVSCALPRFLVVLISGKLLTSQ